MTVPTEDRMITVKEAAERLGYSEWTIRKFCRQGLIQSGRRRTTSRATKGVKILIPKSEITRFIKGLEVGGQ